MRLMLMILCCAGILTGCSKNDAEDEKRLQPSNDPGFGNRPGTPTGYNFELPAGVQQVGTIIGNEEGATIGSCLLDGAGFNVSVTLQLKRDSSSSGPVRIVFPPGLILVSRVDTKQHGVLLDSVILMMPPVQQGGVGGNCAVNLLFSCLNESKDVSDGYSEYDLGPVSDSRSLQELLQKLRNKKINYRLYPNNDHEWFRQQEQLQDLLWKITDGDGLNAEDLTWIDQLPSK